MRQALLLLTAAWTACGGVPAAPGAAAPEDPCRAELERAADAAGVVGTYGEGLVVAASPEHRWAVLLQPRSDTDGNGELAVFRAHHFRAGDQEALVLVSGTGAGIVIDDLTDVTRDGRYVGYVAAGRLWVLDGVSGARHDLGAASAPWRPTAPFDSRPDVRIVDASTALVVSSATGFDLVDLGTSARTTHEIPGGWLYDVRAEGDWLLVSTVTDPPADWTDWRQLPHIESSGGPVPCTADVGGHCDGPRSRLSAFHRPTATWIDLGADVISTETSPHGIAATRLDRTALAEIDGSRFDGAVACAPGSASSDETRSVYLFDDDRPRVTMLVDGALVIACDGGHQLLRIDGSTLPLTTVRSEGIDDDLRALDIEGARVAEGRRFAHVLDPARGVVHVLSDTVSRTEEGTFIDVRDRGEIVDSSGGWMLHPRLPQAVCARTSLRNGRAVRLGCAFAAGAEIEAVATDGWALVRRTEEARIHASCPRVGASVLRWEHVELQAPPPASPWRGGDPADQP